MIITKKAINCKKNTEKSIKKIKGTDCDNAMRIKKRKTDATAIS